MKYAIFFVALFIVNLGYSQTHNQNQSVSDFNLFEVPTVRSAATEVDQVTQGTLFTLNQIAMLELRSAAPSNLTLEVPNEHGDNLILLLDQVEIFSEDFVLETSGGEDLSEIDLGLHYRGTIQGKKKSVVAISIYSDQIRGVAVDDSDNYNLGPIERGSTDYICYKSADLTQEIKDELNYTCGSIETESDVYTEDELGFEEKGLGDIVEIYVELDKSIYDIQGTVFASVVYATSLVNQNAAIYAQEGIGTVASQIYVWTTTDPYDGVNSCDDDIRDEYLCDFKEQFSGFNGDLAILVIGSDIGGVAAGFDGICNSNPDESMCIAGQFGTVVNTFPTYSYNTYVFAHELGHLFGSRHTHACVWNGGFTAIDGCADTEGICGQPPIPASGAATIMSYCQDQLAGGYIADAPFGPQPGNVIRSKVANGSCLGCTSPTIYIPSVISAGPAIYRCPGDNVPEGYVLAGSQSCAQATIDNDPFCLGDNGGVWDGICAFSYDVCLDDCSIYLPNASTTGPGVYVCPGESVPSGYVLATDQACAETVLNSDGYCVTNIWDNACNSAYFSCIAGCPGSSFTIYLPEIGVFGPAVLVCSGDPAPVGYFLATSQSCAQQIIENDPFCISDLWDGICRSAYEACNPPTCSDGIWNGDEQGVDCGGADCPACPCVGASSIYLPVAPTTGPAVIVCAGDPAPSGYAFASSQACAQAVIDDDPFCLTGNWDSICEGAYDACTGESCTGATTIYLPDEGVSGPAIAGCGLAPVGYSPAASQACAQAVVDDDPFCLDINWDSVCQAAYDACTGESCTGATTVYLPDEGVSGPAIAGCGLVPVGYSPAASQPCAQAVVANDPFCLTDSWDSVCQGAYDACTGESCTGATTIYLPDAFGTGPAIASCGLAPVGYTAAENQACAQSVVAADPFCLTGLWDSICQAAYDECVSPSCQAPSNLDVVEIDFGTANARVNATWTNPEATTNCEVRGGRISPTSYAAGEPEFANINNTQTLVQTTGTTVLFNIVLYNNPNVPFIVGQRYGYEVRCDCANGSGFSDWANITPQATFVVPAPPPGVDPGNVGKLFNAGIDVMKIYPNPAEDLVNIELEMLEEGSVEILLMNAMGQTVMQDRSSGKTTLSRLDIGDLDAGIYMVTVRTTSGMITERLIVK